MSALGTIALLLGILDHLPKAKTKAQPLVLSDVPQDEKSTLYRVRSIGDRVKLIRQLVKSGGLNPKIRALAHAFLSRKCGGEWCVPEKDQKAEVAALFAEVRRRVRYTGDPLRRDTYTTPVRTLFEHMGGDCDDSAAALGALLEAVGYSVRLRVVQTKGYDSWNHIYLVVQLTSTGEWIALDPSQNKPAGWEVPAHMVIHKKDFPV